jgi:hypothetical protein
VGVPAPVTLTFPPGVTSQPVTVPILRNDLAGGPKTVKLMLTNAQGGASLIAPSFAVLTIVNNDMAGTIQFSAATYGVNETGGNATITVTRTGGVAGPVTVDFATIDESAEAGTDYTDASATLTFGAGETSRTVPIAILDIDPVAVEGDKTVFLTLSNPTSGAVLGTRNTAVLTIIDNQ